MGATSDNTAQTAKSPNLKASFVLETLDETAFKRRFENDI